MKQIKHTSNGTTYLLVEVPEWSTNPEIRIENGNIICLYVYHPKEKANWHIADLPTGNWSIVGMADKLTSEQWKLIIDRFEYFAVQGYAKNNIKLSNTLILQKHDTSI